MFITVIYDGYQDLDDAFFCNLNTKNKSDRLQIPILLFGNIILWQIHYWNLA